LAGALKTPGCSHQYELNSVRLVEDRMKGGAVSEDRSPLKEAMDYMINERQFELAVAAEQDMTG
jgi:hypothetical protein